MRVRTTSTQRTYRYVRLAIAATVLFLGTSLGAEIARGGGTLTSVSAAYYTPAQPVFVAALFAVTVALVALSGHSLEQCLLDLAALFVAVVAFVPTPIEAGDVPGYVPDCPVEASCVPAAVVPAVANGMLALAVLGVAGVVCAAVLARVQGTLSAGVGAALAASAAVIGGVIAWWLGDPASFLLGAHNAAAIGFFALIAAVAGLGAARPVAHHERRHGRVRVAYAVIAGGILVALVFVALVVLLRAIGLDLVDISGAPLILCCEAVALVLFAAFWIVQTVELWSEADPAAAAPA